jgi:hypothetical protein
MMELKYCSRCGMPFDPSEFDKDYCMDCVRTILREYKFQYLWKDLKESDIHEHK